MPLTLIVGVSKKVGLPNYGSLGTSCHLEVELDSSLLTEDLVEFHAKVRKVYVACAQAVNEELVRQRAAGSQGHRTILSAAHSNGHERRTGEGQAPTTNGSHVSAKQIEFLRQLAHQVRGIGLCRLEGIAERLCGKPLADLTSLNASALIDAIKAVRDGKLPLDFLFESPT